MKGKVVWIKWNERNYKEDGTYTVDETWDPKETFLKKPTKDLSLYKRFVIFELEDE